MKLCDLRHFFYVRKPWWMCIRTIMCSVDHELKCWIHGLHWLLQSDYNLLVNIFYLLNGIHLSGIQLWPSSQIRAVCHEINPGISSTRSVWFSRVKLVYWLIMPASSVKTAQIPTPNWRWINHLKELRYNDSSTQSLELHEMLHALNYLLLHTKHCVAKITHIAWPEADHSSHCYVWIPG